MPKVTFAEAARPLGIHPNTLKNWQRAGRLPGAEKQHVKGVATWLVDPDEVSTVALQHLATLDNTARQDPTIPADRPDSSSGQARQSEPDNPTTIEDDDSGGRRQSLSPAGNNIDQNIMLWRDSLVAPLTAQLERQFNRIEELARENVNLIRDKEDLAGRVKELEARIEAQQAAQHKQSAIPVEIPTTAVEPPGTPQQEQKQRRWWQLW
jgi:hypothetical protein